VDAALPEAALGRLADPFDGNETVLDAHGRTRAAGE
jgi:hypothetical protein